MLFIQTLISIKAVIRHSVIHDLVDHTYFVFINIRWHHFFVDLVKITF